MGVVNGLSAKQAVSRLRVRYRQERVAYHRARGLTWPRVWEAVVEEYIASGFLHELPNNWDDRSACNDFQRVLERIDKETKTKVNEHRSMMLLRLYTLLEVVMSRALDQDWHAYDRTLSTLDRIAKYEGVQPPVIIQVSNRNAEELAQDQRALAVRIQHLLGRAMTRMADAGEVLSLPAAERELVGIEGEVGEVIEGETVEKEGM